MLPSAKVVVFVLFCFAFSTDIMQIENIYLTLHDITAKIQADEKYCLALP